MKKILMPSKELEVKYKTNEHGIICAHCGRNREESIPQGHKAYTGCDCPGHLKTLIRSFDEMPNLTQRLEDFEQWLENEPCQNTTMLSDGNEFSECIIHSNTQLKCPACRLRLVFFHCIYNAEAYER